MKRLIAIAALVALTAGCVGLDTGYRTGPEQAPPAAAAPSAKDLRPDTAVFAAKGGYEIALDIAIAYAELPRCTAGGTPVCSTQAVVNQVVQSRDVARAALRSAENIVRTPGFGQDAIKTAAAAAEAALQAFVSITNTLRIK